MRLLAAVVVFSPLLATADAPVQLEQSDGQVEVTIDGEPFATFHAKGYDKPFFIDLRAPNGTIVTRSLAKEAVTDHPHHKGLWVSVDEVNEQTHWKEGQPIRNESVEIIEPSSETPGLLVTNTWLDGEGAPVLAEKTLFRIFPDRLLTADIRLSPAGDEAVEFADTKEGFFALRLRDELREQGETGKITNANGGVGEAACWGKMAPWVDYSGTVGGKPLGVAIFDHPANFRPSRYHVRAYGLFGASPFGESAYTNGENEAKPVRLQPGESLRLCYAAFFHAGDAESADVAGRFQKYVAEAGD